MTATTKPVAVLAVMDRPSDGEIIAMANEVFADQGAGRRDNDLFYIRFATLLAERQRDGHAAIAELLDQLKGELKAEKGWDYTEYEKGRMAEKERTVSILQALAAAPNRSEVP